LWGLHLVMWDVELGLIEEWLESLDEDSYEQVMAAIELPTWFVGKI